MSPITSASAPSTSARSPRTPALTSSAARTLGRALRSSASPIPVSNGSPTPPRSPPTIIAAGLEACCRDRRAHARSRTRRRLTTRCAPGSPPATQLDEPTDAQVAAVRGAQQLEQGIGRGDRLETAAVAAAANGAFGADADVAELACEAGDAAMEPAVDHDPGADTRRHHHVDHVREAAAGAERDLGESAEIRIVVDRDVQVEPRRELLGGAQPVPAGQDHRRSDGAVERRSAPRAPSPPRPRATARCPPRRARRRRARPPRRVPLRQHGRRRARRAARRPRSRRGRRRRRGGAGGRSRCRRRRPPTGRAAAGSAAARVRRGPGGGGCSTTRPRPCSSVTSVATVVRERPVARASSLRLAVPRRRRASITRSRLSSRRASSDPRDAIGMHFLPCRRVCQENVRNRAVSSGEYRQSLYVSAGALSRRSRAAAPTPRHGRRAGRT